MRFFAKQHRQSRGASTLCNHLRKPSQSPLAPAPFSTQVAPSCGALGSLCALDLGGLISVERHVVRIQGLL
jgi:hypothetical protein